MKKNGFTLTEILAVVVILGLLFLIVAPPVINQVKVKEDNVTDLQKKMITEAASLYFERTGETSVTIGKLEEEGYLGDNVSDVTEGDLFDKCVNSSLEIQDSC